MALRDAGGQLVVQEAIERCDAGDKVLQKLESSMLMGPELFAEKQPASQAKAIEL